MNSRHDCMQYTHLDIVVRRDTAEIHDLVDLALLGSVCLKKMTSTGIFGLVVCALNCATKRDPSEPSMILAHRKDIKSRSPKK
jgi:hypothetical protein